MITRAKLERKKNYYTRVLLGSGPLFWVVGHLPDNAAKLVFVERLVRLSLV